VHDIRKQGNAFTGKPRPFKVSANKLLKAKGSYDFLPVVLEILFFCYS